MKLIRKAYEKRAKNERKMVLGKQAPFADHSPEWLDLIPDYELADNWACRQPFFKPYYRLFERIDIKRRYRSGPSPWAPGRYTTARWQPYSGQGRFSGLARSLRGAYYAARYSGRHVTPDHYILEHGGPEEYARHMESRRRKTAWTLDL